MSSSRSQLSLFDLPEESSSPAGSIELKNFAQVEELGERLPSGIHLGTSSWTFPGWTGLVYRKEYKRQELTRDSLTEYVRYPLFGTVGIDSTYYTPPRPDLLERYSHQMPDGFRAVCKVWEELTVRRFPAHLRYGERAGQSNPHWLDSRLFREAVLPAFQEVFLPHLGCLVFEFPPMAPESQPDPKEFALDLDRFFEQLPRDLPYGVEIRNRALLTRRYLEVLSHHGVSHVLNQWSWMPDIGRQAKMPNILTANHVVLRLLLRPGTRYADRKKQMAPFNQILDPDPNLRRNVAELALRAREEGREVFVLVNNKAEGSAPLTVQALAESITQLAKPS